MTNKEKYLFLEEFVCYKDSIKELLVYSENKFIANEKEVFNHYDVSVNTWEIYEKEAIKGGVFEILKKYLVQLQFPIQEGISKTENYINSTLRGRENNSSSTLVLNQPELLKFKIYKSPLVGKIPVIIAANDEDFNLLISALSNKNEPLKLPKSMGAAFISGINNWDRIKRLKRNWLKNNFNSSWSIEFRENILPKPHLYKDRLIVLSTKPYSGIKGDLLGFSEDQWRETSLLLRLHHECCHLFTLKNYGHMAKNIHDEIIADYAGIVNSLQHFNKTCFLLFFGLEDYPNYRKGGRLENYQDKMSQAAFKGLVEIVRRIAENLHKFDISLGQISSVNDQIHRIECLCEVDILTMASSKGSTKLLKKYKGKNKRA